MSNNLTWLEWTQTDRPRVLKFSVSIESVNVKVLDFVQPLGGLPSPLWKNTPTLYI